MRNLLAFAAAAVVAFLAVGYFLNWYQVRAIPGPAGHEDVHFDVDGKKIGADVKKGEEELMDALKKAEEARAAKEAEASKDGEPAKKDGPAKKDKPVQKEKDDAAKADFSKPGAP